MLIITTPLPASDGIETLQKLREKIANNGKKPQVLAGLVGRGLTEQHIVMAYLPEIEAPQIFDSKKSLRKSLSISSIIDFSRYSSTFFMLE